MQIIQEPGCVDALKKLEQSNNSRVVNAAKGALWKISGEQEHQKHREDSDTPARSGNMVKCCYTTCQKALVMLKK